MKAVRKVFEIAIMNERVEGRFMLKISVKEVENQMSRIIDKKSYDLFVKLMGSDNK